MLLSTSTLHARYPLLALLEADAWQAIVDYYAQCLPEKAIPVACEILGVDESTIRSMRVGFSDRSLGTQLPSNQTIAGRRIREQLTTLGLLKENGRESLRGYITIPLFDGENRITGIEAHRLTKTGTPSDVLQLGTGVCKQASGARDQASEAIEEQHVAPIPTREVSEGSAPVSRPLLADGSTHDETSRDATPQISPSLTQRVEMATPASDIVADANSITVTQGDRSYKIRGLEKNMSSLTLRVSIAASRSGGMHLDTVDLMRATARQAFVRAAAAELYCEEETIKKDLGRVLLQLEDLRNLQIEAAKRSTQSTYNMTEPERDAAMQLLHSPELISRIIQDLEACGMVGEIHNKLVCYLAVVSRKLATPLALLIQSSSAAGKTTLMDNILAMTPPEETLRLSNLTSHSLYYLESHQIRHRTLAVSEDHGLDDAAYALKLLQSEGKLTHATVTRGSDGRSVTQLQTVEGPVQLLLTSTSRNIDEELANRCLILTVDESVEQTRAIQTYQRSLQTRQGYVQQHGVEDIRRVHRNAQRLIRPLRVFNPLAPSLEFVSHRLRTRRDHAKYLSLIQAIALLHQHQRPVHCDADGTQWIEAIQSDVDLATRLMSKLLSQSLSELSPQTTRCLDLLQRYVEVESRKLSLASKKEFRFTRRAFRESTGWSDHQVRTHLDRLIQLEHIVVHRGKQGASFVYELVD